MYSKYSSSDNCLVATPPILDLPTGFLSHSLHRLRSLKDLISVSRTANRIDRICLRLPSLNVRFVTTRPRSVKKALSRRRRQI